MKTATIHMPRDPGRDVFRRGIATIIRALAEAGNRHYQKRMAAASLRTVSDRTLKDIGIHRTEISSVVHDASGDRRRCHEEE
ncbi:MAG: DUF1127 domain-containing protein [Hyphomicrobiales bacterium]